MNFTQGIRIRCADPVPVAELLAGWDRSQSTTDLMGYIGTRLLADRDRPGDYLILSEVDGDLTPAEEAERNNQRQETERWATTLRSIVEGEPEWAHYDELYRTGITGNLRTG